MTPTSRNDFARIFICQINLHIFISFSRNEFGSTALDASVQFRRSFSLVISIVVPILLQNH